ncbi:hypothetical protein CALCODRAFT_190021 [Calocera cornea HHB12733]|uniref:Uncharacterized protein n=1 Tax=Calocera cornea HHB12733 TaxID=1353952 RepID=A0A165C842_9BASI|nr:hypothetical protein CALCODRAFT_190021 [Calocera cornea HHB12733]
MSHTASTPIAASVGVFASNNLADGPNSPFGLFEVSTRRGWTLIQVPHIPTTALLQMQESLNAWSTQVHSTLLHRMEDKDVAPRLLLDIAQLSAQELDQWRQYRWMAIVELQAIVLGNFGRSQTPLRWLQVEEMLVKARAVRYRTWAYTIMDQGLPDSSLSDEDRSRRASIRQRVLKRLELAVQNEDNLQKSISEYRSTNATELPPLAQQFELIWLEALSMLHEARRLPASPSTPDAADGTTSDLPREERSSPETSVDPSSQDGNVPQSAAMLHMLNSPPAHELRALEPSASDTICGMEYSAAASITGDTRGLALSTMDPSPTASTAVPEDISASRAMAMIPYIASPANVQSSSADLLVYEETALTSKLGEHELHSSPSLPATRPATSSAGTLDKIKQHDGHGQLRPLFPENFELAVVSSTSDEMAAAETRRASALAPPTVPDQSSRKTTTSKVVRSILRPERFALIDFSNTARRQTRKVHFDDEKEAATDIQSSDAVQSSSTNLPLYEQSNGRTDKSNEDVFNSDAGQSTLRPTANSAEEVKEHEDLAETGLLMPESVEVFVVLSSAPDTAATPEARAPSSPPAPMTGHPSHFVSTDNKAAPVVLPITETNKPADLALSSSTAKGQKRKACSDDDVDDPTDTQEFERPSKRLKQDDTRDEMGVELGRAVVRELASLILAKQARQTNAQVHDAQPLHGMLTTHDDAEEAIVLNNGDDESGERMEQAVPDNTISGDPTDPLSDDDEKMPVAVHEKTVQDLVELARGKIPMTAPSSPHTQMSPATVQPGRRTTRSMTAAAKARTTGSASAARKESTKGALAAREEKPSKHPAEKEKKLRKTVDAIEKEMLRRGRSTKGKCDRKGRK